jgi:hypothetical protein
MATRKRTQRSKKPTGADLVEVMFTLTLDGNIEGLVVGVDGCALLFDDDRKAVRRLTVGAHNLSWDSFGTHPGGFTITHASAKPRSTAVKLELGQRRADGSRAITVHS